MTRSISCRPRSSGSPPTSRPAAGSGLTATLVREDDREEDVFSLIGPKKFDVPWRVLESKGWIAEAQCHEIRLGLPGDIADGIRRGRVARQVPPGQREPGQGRPGRAAARAARRAGRPGAGDRPVPQATAADRRAVRPAAHHRRRPRTPIARTFTAGFAPGRLRRLVLSKVGNFAIDLPDANVMIQVSGTFGSRQEEAQRLGRILRPKEGEKPALLLHAGDPRHPRDGLRPSSPALPDRAGLQLRDRGRVGADHADHGSFRDRPMS